MTRNAEKKSGMQNCIPLFFAALAGWVLLHEAMTPRELFGCVLMFAAVLLVQLNP